MKKFNEIALGIIAPLFIAVLIYLFYRNSNLVIFKCVDLLNLLPQIKILQTEIQNLLPLPSWAIYSLPGALWLLSSMNLLLWLWEFNINFKSITWIITPFIFAILLEFLQYLHFTDGRFDWIDLLFYSITALLFFVGSIVKRKEESSERSMHWQALTLCTMMILIVYGADKMG